MTSETGVAEVGSDMTTAGTDSTGVVVAGVTPDPLLSDWVFAPADCWLGFPSEPSVWVTPRTVCRTVLSRLFATVPAGPLAELALWLGPSTPWLGALIPWLLAAESPALGSAAAIAPPAPPMSRPVKSTQTPAAERRCVDMGSSSQKHGDLVGRLPML